MFIAQTSEAQRGRLIKCQGQRGGERIGEEIV